MDKTTTAIIVEYGQYVSSEWTRRFVKSRGPFASVVLFVDTPPSDTELNDLYEWDVVISNAKGIPSEEFRVAALAALSNHSNVYPAITLDVHKYEDIYLEAGVLLLLDIQDKQVKYDERV